MWLGHRLSCALQGLRPCHAQAAAFYGRLGCRSQRLRNAFFQGSYAGFSHATPDDSWQLTEDRGLDFPCGCTTQEPCSNDIVAKRLKPAFYQTPGESNLGDFLRGERRLPRLDKSLIQAF